MSKQKTRVKKRRPKSTALGKEILAALSEFTEALKTGEVADHLRRRQTKLARDAASHKSRTAKKPPTLSGKNGKKVVV